MHTQPSPRGRCARTATLLQALLVLCVSHALAYHTQAQPVASYHIGNSLTWDARPDWGLTQLAADAGLSLTTGYHIRCNGSLDHIASNPNDFCVNPNSFGLYTQALTENTWDAVTLQPFSSTGTPSTPRSEYEAMKSLIQLARQNPNNHDTTFYLYTGWMSASSAGTDFYNAWHNPAPIDPDTDLIRNAASFAWIYDELANDPELAGVNLHMIPVGDVLAEIDQRMTLGTLPGFVGAEDLYRDDLHMNNLGWFVASNTMLATLLNTNPTGTPTNNAFVLAPGQTESIEITPELGSLIQDAVWDVIRTHPLTGILHGDLNADGFVGIDDLNLILANWNHDVSNAAPRADISGDGYVGIDDLNTVLSNWNSGISPPQRLVPEPKMIWLFIVPIIVIVYQRRPKHTSPLIGGAAMILLSFTPTTHAAEPVNVLIIGDSTVHTYPLDNPLAGWGQVLPDYYTTQDIVFSNWAAPGRSSKTYITEGLWANGLNSTNPDYVLIQFGHNDNTGHNLPGETWPDPVPTPLPAEGLGSQDIDWFRNNMRTYITEARAVGAIPVLITPMERRLFDASDQVRPLNLPWAQAAIAVAQEEHVQLIDLNTFSVDLINGLGVEGSSYLHPYLESGVQDNVHTSHQGAETYAQFIASQLSFIPGDLNADGFVGIDDLNLVLANWNQDVSITAPSADPSGDGYVGIDDLNAVLGNWNTGIVPPTNVPEPALGLLLLSPILIYRRRCRRRGSRRPGTHQRLYWTTLYTSVLAMSVMTPGPAEATETVINQGTSDWIAAARTGRADMLILGDSIVNHGLGWTGGVANAARTRLGLAGTGMVATGNNPATYPGMGGARLELGLDWLQPTSSLPDNLEKYALGNSVTLLNTDAPAPKFWLAQGIHDSLFDRSRAYDWQLWVSATGGVDGSIQGLRASRLQSPYTRQVIETSPSVPVSALDTTPQLVEFSFSQAAGEISDWHEYGLVNTSRDMAVFYNRLIDPNATGVTVTGWGYPGGTMNDYVTDIYDNGRIDQTGRAAYLSSLVHGNSGKLNVMIAMGVNDSNENEASLNQGITPGYSVEAFIDNIQTQIALVTADWAQAGLPAADLSFTLPSTYQMPTDVIGSDRVSRLLEYRDALKAMAQTDSRISFIDMWSASPTAAEAVANNYIHDGVHPSREGSLLYGAILMNELLESTPIQGDLDGDGFVGINDLNIVLGNWNVQFQEPWVLIQAPNDYRADPTYDGYVGIDDLNTVLPNWNAGTPPSATSQNLAPNAPEPASLLILTSLLGLQFRRV